MKKYKLDDKKLNSCLALASSSGLEYKLTLTNYTAKIECEKSEVLNFHFMKEFKKITFFNIYRLLKKECSEHILSNKITLGEVKYYEVVSKEDFVSKEIYNIDLTSAYLHVLKNENIISDDLYKKLNKLPKIDRLGIVGMLASKKHVYYMKGDNIEDLEIIEDKGLSNLFFYCVFKTHEIMTEIKKILGESFVFIWVDGIYFTDQEKIKECKEYLKTINYPFKVEVLKNFSYNKYNGNADISYLKMNKTKSFNIPMEKGTFLNDMFNLLNGRIK